MRLVAAAMLLMTGLAAGNLSGAIRNISEGERAAVRFAADYLAGGAEALVDDLATASPLRKLSAAEVAAEIETRLGPPAGADWELLTVVEALKDKAAAFSISYPSGVDETLFFELVQEGGAWKILDLRIMAMPSSRPPLFPPLEPEPAKPEPSRPSAAPRIAAAAGGGVAALLAVAALFLMRSHRGLGRATYAAAALVVAGSAALAINGERSGEVKPAAPAPTVEAPSGMGLGQLLPLRRALAAGGEEADAALAAPPPRGPAGDVARLWRAHWDLNEMKLAAVKKALAAFPPPSNVPLAEILRARLALVENQPEAAVVAYQNAINAGPGRDSLWAEMSSALMAGGFDEMARKNLTRLVEIGSREPNVYYAKASLSETIDELEKELANAWYLQPIGRDDLVESGMLWSLVRKREATFINLSDPNEPRFASPLLATQSVPMPAGSLSRVSGEYLHVAIGESQLSVAGGAPLAPAGAIQVGADEWSRLRDERALRDVDSLLTSPPAAASYMQPALRNRITNAAQVLAEHNRWGDLVTLTSAISPKSEFVPAPLFFLRAKALQRVQRENDARGLLLELASSPVLVRKRDTGSMEALGEMLSSFDEYDRATRMFERARAVEANPYQDVRITQIAMDQKLARQYQTLTTTNFEIHYPNELHPSLANRLGVVLEGELKRLQSWVPVRSFKPVVVNVVWWHDFKSIYTGSDDVLGFYNGKITLPLAGIADFNPEIVGLITHELTHAMIAQATNDQAPRWFHEGLAQRVQMIEYHANAFNMYDDDKLFAVSVLDPVLQGSRDGDMVGAAYIVAQTLIRFVEARHGVAGIRKLLDAYAAGATSLGAITTVTGATLADFNTEFRRWGKSESRIFANTIPVRYDDYEDDGRPRFSTTKSTTKGAERRP